MPDCFICNMPILSNDKFLKLPCCLRKVHDKCQLEISCRKWQKMAKNEKFGIEKCTICNAKITTPIEKTFISLYLTIKLARKTLSENDIKTGEEILGINWKKEVYNNFGNFLKDKYCISKIRNSNKSISESLSEYMIQYTKSILLSLENESKLEKDDNDDQKI